jgi:hypothetical protein
MPCFPVQKKKKKKKNRNLLNVRQRQRKQDRGAAVSKAGKGVLSPVNSKPAKKEPAKNALQKPRKPVDNNSAPVRSALPKKPSPNQKQAATWQTAKDSRRQCRSRQSS